jgi:hypothetical protein
MLLVILVGALCVADAFLYHGYYSDAVLNAGNNAIKILVDGAQNLANRFSPR